MIREFKMKFIEKCKSIYYDYFASYPYRYYFNKHKCIFIHIPKCAGTSMLTVLSNGKKIYRDHATWFDYYRYNPYKFEEYFKFAIVRNPYDRVVSLYAYMSNSKDKKNRNSYYYKYFKKNNIDFEKFVLEFLSYERINSYVLFKPQHHFIFDYKYELKIDKIIKIEDINLEYDKLKEKLNLKSQYLIKANSSNRDEYKFYYKNNELIEKVKDIYKYDFKLLNYSTNI
jgi:hypothetical protein